MVYFMETLGMDTGINLDAMSDIGAWITRELGKENGSTVGKAVLGARTRAIENAAREAIKAKTQGN
jgi:hydroxymethylglutaryl-CoA lyase